MTELFEKMKTELTAAGFEITEEDLTKPWGGYLRIAESQRDQFISAYFGDYRLPDIDAALPLTPKILMVAPGKRLSWQYHHRRAEIWSIVAGPVGVERSLNDTQTAPVTVDAGNVVKMAAGERHRLIGLEGWGVVAELWEHTDASEPSNEADIVRVADDFGR